MISIWWYVMLFIHKMIFNIFVLNELYSELLMLGAKTFSIVFRYSTLVCGLKYFEYNIM